ncbi:MAG: arylesterase [Gemmatimonadaceae bacterium]
MRASFGLILLALATAGCGAGAREEEGAARAARADTATSDSGRQRTILFVGTSLTAGLGLEPEEAYPALIAQRIDSLGLSYEVVNAGVSGETSAGTLRRIDWILRDPIDVLVLETGANDGLRGLAVDSMRANIQAIIDTVRRRRPQARLVLVGMEAPPNLGPRYTSEFRSVFPELARANGATLVPFLLDGVAGVTALNQGDGIHPNGAGARIVADNVWRVLGPLLTLVQASMTEV